MGKITTYFSCDICPSKYSRKYDLIRHVREQHSSESPPQCDVCQKKFSWKKDLYKHVRLKHSSEPPPHFTCDICPSKFSRKSCFNHHVRHKHSSEPLPEFICDVCHTKFSRKGDLYRHVKTVNCGDISEKYGDFAKWLQSKKGFDISDLIKESTARVETWVRDWIQSMFDANVAKTTASMKSINLMRKFEEIGIFSQSIDEARLQALRQAFPGCSFNEDVLTKPLCIEEFVYKVFRVRLRGKTLCMSFNFSKVMEYLRWSDVCLYRIPCDDKSDYCIHTDITIRNEKALYAAAGVRTVSKRFSSKDPNPNSALVVFILAILADHVDKNVLFLRNDDVPSDISLLSAATATSNDAVVQRWRNGETTSEAPRTLLPTIQSILNSLGLQSGFYSSKSFRYGHAHTVVKGKLKDMQDSDIVSVTLLNNWIDSCATWHEHGQARYYLRNLFARLKSVAPGRDDHSVTAVREALEFCSLRLPSSFGSLKLDLPKLAANTESFLFSIKSGYTSSWTLCYLDDLALTSEHKNEEQQNCDVPMELEFDPWPPSVSHHADPSFTDSLNRTDSSGNDHPSPVTVNDRSPSSVRLTPPHISLGDYEQDCHVANDGDISFESPLRGQDIHQTECDAPDYAFDNQVHPLPRGTSPPVIIVTPTSPTYSSDEESDFEDGRFEDMNNDRITLSSSEDEEQSLSAEDPENDRFFNTSYDGIVLSDEDD